MAKLLAITLTLSPAPAFAHAADDLLAWNTEAWLIALLIVAAGLYAFGLSRLLRQSVAGRNTLQRRGIAYAAGLLSLCIALVSPLDSLGNALFSAHMIQHEILMIVAAPLLIAGRPLAVFMWALPRLWRRPVASVALSPPWQAVWLRLSLPSAAWMIHAAVLWLWHAPTLFEASLNNDTIHEWQHASFLASALLFWWSLTRCRPGMAALYVLTTMIHTGMLGALLTFASIVWYQTYIDTAPAWGLTALEDQQLGGLVMWVLAGFILMAAALAMAWDALDRRSLPVAADSENAGVQKA